MSIKKRLLPSLNIEPEQHNVPEIHEGVSIPKIIHQTYPSKELPTEFKENIDRLKAQNPEWEHRLYDDADISQFISMFYGPQILAYYDRINPRYGAAKADLFRYLLLYKFGGVYLDIKSSFNIPIARVLQPGDRYLLAQWSNKAGEKRAGWGMPSELQMVPGGEYQQWHIVSVPGHPFLKAAIEMVLTNIDRYKPWLHGTGGNGVLRLTGPVAYTLAIHPLRHLHTHRLVRNETELGLEYSMLKHSSHKPLFKNHYTTLTDSVVKMEGLDIIGAKIYSFVKRTKQQVCSLFA